MGEENKLVYICPTTDGLDALVREHCTADFVLTELQDRFPALQHADLRSPVSSSAPEWNLLLGVEDRRIHILGYDYARPENASVGNKTMIFQTRSTRKKRDLPLRMIQGYLTTQSVIFDRFVNSQKILTKIVCEGSLVIVVNTNTHQGEHLAGHYEKLVREQGGMPMLLEPAYQPPTPLIEPLVDDSWRRSL